MKPRPSGRHLNAANNLFENSLKHFFTGIMAVSAAMMFFSCENPISVVQELSREDTLAAITAQDVIYTRSDSGRVQMRLKAPRMNRFDGDNPSIEFPEGFLAFFYDSADVVSSTIEAGYGISYERTKLLLAQTDVVVENLKTQEVLNTDTLYWDQREKTIFTRAPVKITSPDRIIYGDSLTASENFEQRVIHNIRARLEFDEEEAVADTMQQPAQDERQ